MEQLLPILQLPARCLLQTRLTKAFFKRNFELTISEKNLLDNAEIISAMEWLASISPDNANITLYKDSLYLYEEVQVISVRTNEANFDKNIIKIAELVQKHIPYPILLFIYCDTAFVLNTCDKPINQNDNSRRTLEKMYYTQTIPLQNSSVQQQDFILSLSFEQLDKTNLQTLYQAYVQRIIALQAAKLVGTFVPRPQNRSQAQLQQIETIEALSGQLNSLKNQLKRAKALSERVQLNMQLQQLKKQISDLTESLNQETVS